MLLIPINRRVFPISEANPSWCILNQINRTWTRPSKKAAKTTSTSLLHPIKTKSKVASYSLNKPRSASTTSYRDNSQNSRTSTATRDDSRTRRTWRWTPSGKSTKTQCSSRILWCSWGSWSTSDWRKRGGASKTSATRRGSLIRTTWMLVRRARVKSLISRDSVAT